MSSVLDLLGFIVSGWQSGLTSWPVIIYPLLSWGSGRCHYPTMLLRELTGPVFSMVWIHYRTQFPSLTGEPSIVSDPLLESFEHLSDILFDFTDLGFRPISLWTLSFAFMVSHIEIALTGSPPRFRVF